MASLLYGAGLRLLEALRLRVKDVDFARPRADRARRQGAEGPRDAAAGVAAPRCARTSTRCATSTRPTSRRGRLRRAARRPARKYPTPPREWPWQWVFPATRHYVDPRRASAAATTCTRP